MTTRAKETEMATQAPEFRRLAGQTLFERSLGDRLQERTFPAGTVVAVLEPCPAVPDALIVVYAGWRAVVTPGQLTTI